MSTRVQSGRKPQPKVLVVPATNSGLRIVTLADYHADVCKSRDYRPLMVERCTCGLVEAVWKAERESAERSGPLV